MLDQYTIIEVKDENDIDSFLGGGHVSFLNNEIKGFNLDTVWFVDALKKQGLKVWYDTNKLKWGDSMREKIDKGLAKSRYGVVVLSPNYIAEHKYWTKTELNGLFQVESFNGKVILPIWHNLTKKQVVEYSPIITDRKAMTTASMTPEEIAEEMKELFTLIETEEE